VIHLGLRPADKAGLIAQHARQHDLKKIVVCSPERFRFDLPDLPCPVQWVDWPEIIMYRTFYPLLQEIDQRTLVVVNECLRTQDRYDLTYNCIRHYLNQAGHVRVFQWFPCIDTMQDFMTLFDFATGSRWKRTPWDIDPPEPVALQITERTPVIIPVPVPTDARLRAAYDAERTKLFAGLGAKDPHTLPRNLYMVGAKARAAHAPPFTALLGRNTKTGAAPYKADRYADPPYTVLDLPHNLIDLADVSALTGQTHFNVLACDLKADRWYSERATQWAQRIADGYADLRSWA
jgi:hypothetical protein